MKTVGTRELKQNPADVIARVLASGQAIEITAHGKPTGVRFVPDGPGQATWVRGEALNALPNVGSDDNEDQMQDIASAFAEADYLSNPWEGRT